MLIDHNTEQTCRTVRAFDDTISDGTKTFRIEVRSDDPVDNTVPVVFDPVSIPVRVVDNDGESVQHTHTHTHTMHDLLKVVFLSHVV